MLEKLQISFTSPNNFNDPFDCLPAAKNLVSEENNRERYRDIIIPMLYQKHMEKYPLPPLTMAQFAAKNVTFEEFNKVTKSNESKYQKLRTDRIRETLLKVGVFCLSKNGHSPAMWAHYGKDHTGFLVEIDDAHEFFVSHDGSGPSKRLEVTYSDTRPEWDHMHNIEVDEWLSTKSLEWQYEREVRFMRFLDFFADAQPNHERKKCLFAIPADAILSVTLGSRAAPEFANKIDNVLKQPQLKHVKRFLARPNDEKFQIDRGAVS